MGVIPQLWSPGRESVAIDALKYKELNRGISDTFRFISRLGEEKNFSVVPDFIKKEQTGGVSYLVASNISRAVYFDRNQLLWGPYFVSIRDAFLYLQCQAFYVFLNKQRIQLNQWKKDIDEGKTGWWNFYFKTNFAERPYKIPRFTQNVFIKFISRLKYRWHEKSDKFPFALSDFCYNNTGFINHKVQFKSRKRYFLSSY